MAVQDLHGGGAPVEAPQRGLAASAFVGGHGDERGDAQVADNVLLAATWRSRLKGLLGRKTFPEGEGLHIAPCNSIHMFFMHFPKMPPS